MERPIIAESSRVSRKSKFPDADNICDIFNVDGVNSGG